MILYHLSCITRQICFNVFSVLTAALNIPGIPDSVKEFVAVTLDYVSTGIAILSNYMDVEYVLSLFFIVIAVDAGIMLYKIILWVLKKIPMLGIE